MSKKQVDNKKEVTVEALEKMLDEQDSKISTLSEETDRVKRNSKIMLISSIIMILIVVGFISAPVIANTVFRKPLTWHEVKRFSGAFQEFGHNDTDSFHISSDRWRMCWYVHSAYNVSADMPFEDVEFRLVLYDPSSPYFYTFQHHGYLAMVTWLKLADFGGSIAQGVEWFYERNGIKYITGSGDFSLSVLGASLEWEIVVQAYY